MWAAERKADGVVVGTVLLLTLPNDEHGEVEIGWHLHPDAWGQGYACEAAGLRPRRRGRTARDRRRQPH
ncbi:hypothetical protein GCM10023350_07020 [Nocardioides endophyticus]|uniref:N-acetyltransferase domain-containing protein n=1 Tax=Nocardioides endophyticus TaxID=1353775 RepID=A0ABP8YEC3_9ACTN